MAQQPHFSLSITTPPAVEPVAVSYVKSWLRVDGDDHDDQIADLISMARSLVEDYAGRALVNTVYTAYYDRFPLVPNSQYTPGNPNTLAPVLQNTWPLDPSIWALKLPRSPLVSVAYIKYYDNSGVLQTMDPTTYSVDASSEPPRLAPASGSYWPSNRWQPNAVQVQFTAGYGSATSAVPAKFRRAICATVSAWYDAPS
ncbi:MAG: head-tail connector protein, partial [Patescibacteria group bacterium]|nr:head-tail connector protein [Patescibacteria group bacterium]